MPSAASSDPFAPAPSSGLVGSSIQGMLGSPKPGAGPLPRTLTSGVPHYYYHTHNDNNDNGVVVVIGQQQWHHHCRATAYLTSMRTRALAAPSTPLDAAPAATTSGGDPFGESSSSSSSDNYAFGAPASSVGVAEDPLAQAPPPPPPRRTSLPLPLPMARTPSPSSMLCPRHPLGPSARLSGR